MGGAVAVAQAQMATQLKEAQSQLTEHLKERAAASFTW